MSLTEDIIDAKYVITGYQPGCIMINSEAYTQSVIVCPSSIISPWTMTDITQFNKETAEEILHLNPEVVLFGTGEQLILPDPKFIAYFAKHEVGFEVMSTDAACRTYGILVSEGRKAAAALIVPNVKED